jgi:hypothetical protein
MAADDTRQLQARLTKIQARLRALAEADDQASWGGSNASRGGSRQEQVDLVAEAERIRSQLGERSFNGQGPEAGETPR